MEEIDLVRQLVELAVTSGRSHQSSQTGYVHYCHQKLDESVNHTIPPYENILFALALIRMQTVQNITEGKLLIDKILNFQDPESGNFPIYLHEYPHCRDRFMAVHFLAPLYWVLKGFGKVLGDDLKAKIQASVKLIISYAGDHVEKAPFQIAIKVAAGEAAFGRLWSEKDLEKRGLDRLEALRKASESPDFGTWFSPTYIGETLIALQMIYDNISHSPWKSFWSLISQTWFRPACTYIGVPVKLLQWREEPQPTLYDLFLGDFAGGYPYHAFIDQPFQLQGALVRDHDEHLDPVTYPMTIKGEVAGHPWIIHQETHYAYTLIDAGAPVPPELKKGFHYTRVVWGDRNRIHSLSCQGGNFTSMKHEVVEGGVDLTVWLAEDPDQIDREKSHEVRFFVDQHEGLDITVQGKKATTFNFREEVAIKSPGLTCTLSFELIEGDARMMGHIQPGNRPSQVDLKGENRFNAYDWEISLRTIRRYTPCQLKIALRFSDF